MRALAALVVLAANLTAALAAANSTKVVWDGFHVTWSMGGAQSYADGKAFFSLPTSAADAQQLGWVQERRELYATLWGLPGDPRVSLIYDLQGAIAGIQVSFPLADLEDTPYDWRQHPLFFEDTIFDQQVAGGRLYVVPPSVLENGGRSSVDEVGTGVWLKSGDDVVYVPQDANELEALGWSEENCIPYMGRHYYYNISESLDCRDFEPFFVLVDNSKNWVHGMGFQTFGRKSQKDREWIENVPGAAIKPTVPNAPDCLTEWADEYGILSLHVYFTDKPYNYKC